MDDNNEDKISKMFNLIDIDNEGGIPKTKLKEILQKSVGDKFSEEEFDKIVEEMHLVDNGNISLMSFMTAMLTRENINNIPVDFGQLENAIRSANKEDNGQIGVTGWQNILSNLGINLSETEVIEVMNIACGIMKQVGGIDISGLYGVDGAKGGPQTVLADENDAEMVNATLGEEKDVTQVENTVSNEIPSSEPNQEDENKTLE